MSRLRFGIPRPLDYGSYGMYSIGQTSGLIPAALAADSEIFQFRWAHASKLAVVQRVLISAAVSTTYFAAGVPLRVALVRSSSWTVAGTGGTALTPATTGKRRSNMADTSLAAGDCRIATTAALGAGTKTLEANALKQLSCGAPITSSLSGQIFAPDTPLFDAYIGDGHHPIVLAQNEGLSITVPEVPATGTWKAVVNIEWAEVDRYPY